MRDCLVYIGVLLDVVDSESCALEKAKLLGKSLDGNRKINLKKGLISEDIIFGRQRTSYREVQETRGEV